MKQRLLGNRTVKLTVLMVGLLLSTVAQAQNNSNITISTANTTGGGFSGGIFTPTLNSANIKASDLVTEINSNINVTINTACATCTQSGNITTSTAVTAAPTSATQFTLTVNAGGSITISNAFTFTPSANATDPGTNLTLNANAGTNPSGTGSVTVSAAITTTGGTNTNANGAAGGNITISGPSGINIGTSGALTANGGNGKNNGGGGTGGNAGNISLTSASGITLSSNLTASGGTGKSGSGTNGNFTISDGASTYTTGSGAGINDGQWSTTNSVITGGNLTISGSGTFLMAGVNVYTGTTTVSNGILKFANNETASGGPMGAGGNATVQSGGTIDLAGWSESGTGAETLTISGTGPDGDGALRNTGGGTENYSRAIVLAGNASIAGINSTLTISGGVTGSYTLTLDGAGGGVISTHGFTTSGGSLTKVNSTGTWTLSVANSYTGTTSVTAGTLALGIANAISSGSSVDVNGGTLSMSTYSDATGTVIVEGNGSITGTTGVLSTASTNLFDMRYGSVSAILGGTGTPLTKSTANTVTLSGTNTYTGVTTINAGTLSVGTIGNGGVSGNLGTATNAAANLVLGGGTLAYTGSSASTNRAFTLTAATTSTINVTNTLTMTGGSAGTTGALVVAGTGTLLFSTTANGYTGGTTVSSGSTLTMGLANVLASTGTLTLNGGTFITGTTTGFSQTMGALILGANSTFNLGTGVHTITFAASNTQSWTGSTMLTVKGWLGAYNGTGGTAGKIVVGNTANNLSGGQLGQIQFYNSTYSVDVPATIISSTAEVVPEFTAPSGLTYNASNTATAGTLFSLSPLTITGYVVTYSISSGSLPSGLNLNAATGVISGTPTVAGTSTFVVTATNPGGSTNSNSTSITVNPGTASTFSFSAISSPQIAGTNFSVTITALDAYGNTATGFTGTTAMTTNAGTISPATSIGFSSGVLTENFYVTQAGTSKTITATSTSPSAAGTSGTFTVNAATANSLVMSNISSPQTAGTNFSVTVTAEDVYGNTATSFTGTASMTTNAGTISPATSTNFSSGVLTENFYVTQAGTLMTITATTTSPSLNVTSNAFTVNPGTASSFTISTISSPQTAGTNFSATITALDAYGNTATGFNGTANMTTNAGTISPATSTGFSSGVLTENFYVTQAGSLKSITATSTSPSATGTSNTFTVNPGTLSTFGFSAIGTQTAGTNFSVTITAEDAYGNTVTSFTGTTNMTTNAGTISPATSTGFSSGVLTENFYVTQAGTSKTITATSTSPSATGTSGTFMVNAATASSLVMSNISSPQVAGTNFSVTITAEDVYGNTATSFTGTANMTTNAGTISPATSPNFSSGVLTENFYVTQAGTLKTITATTTSPSLNVTSNTFTVNAGTAASFSLSTISSPQTAGTNFSVTITALDAYGNTATGFAGTTNMTTNAGTISPATSTGFSSGVLTENFYVTQAGTSKTITATSTSPSATGTSNTFTVNPGALSTFGFSAIGTQTAGTNFSVTITAEDAYGNTVTSFAGTTNMTTNAGTISPATSTGFSSGVLTENFDVTQAGTSKTITATSTSPSATGTSGTFTVNAGTATSLEMSNISSPQAVGANFSVTITAQDVYGNTATSFAGTANMTTNAVTISPATSSAFSNGVLTENFYVTQAGTLKTITATTTSPAMNVTSNTFTVNGGGATVLAISPITTPQTAGTNFSVTVQAQDQYGNAANVTPSTIISLAVSPAGTGILSGNTGTITSGTSSVTLSAVNYTQAATVTFTASKTSGMSLSTSAASNSVTFNANTFTKLQILVPGMSAAPGSSTGYTGSASTQTAGIDFTATVNAVDAYWNVVSSAPADNIHLTSTDPSADLGANAPLSSGTVSLTVELATTGKTITAADATNGGITSNTSPAITINAFATAASDYFRSQATGNWSTVATWQSSHNNVDWFTATLAPTASATLITVQSPNTVTIASNLSITNVVVNAGGQVNLSSGITLTISNGTQANDFDVSGTFENNTGGTITTTGVLAFESGGVYEHNFTNTSAGTIPAATWNTGSTCTILASNNAVPSGLGQTFANFTWDYTGQTAALNLNGALTTVTGTLWVEATNSGSLSISNAASATIGVGGFEQSAGTFYLNNGGGTNTTALNNSGGWTMNGGTFTTNASHQSTVNFTGSSSAINGTVASQTFYNVGVNLTAGQTLSVGGSTTTLTVNNFTETTGNFTAPATMTIGGVLTLTAGTYTAGANTSIAGNWTNNGGTFTPNGGIVTFTGNSSAINGSSASQTFYNVVVNLTAGQTLSTGGSTTALTVNNLTETTGNFTAPATLTINGALTLTAGTFTAGANTNIAGNWTNNGGTFTPNGGTVTFDGSSSQAINGTAASQTFYNTVVNLTAGQALSTGGSTTTLTVNNLTETTGNFTAPATLNINGILTLTAGTYTAGANTNIAGNWTNNSGAFTANSGLVTFDGGSAQTIGGSASSTFSSLTLSNTSGLSLSLNTNIGGTLTFMTNGLVTTGSNTLIMTSTSSSSVSGAGAGKYVYGNLQKNIANGSSVTQNFEVGDASNYTPVNLSFAGTVSGSGYMTAYTVNSTDANILSSTIDETENVNRYWNLTNGGVTFSSYSATLNFVAGDIDGGANTANFIVGLDNSGWTYPTVGTKASTSTQATGITTFGSFSVGQGGAAVPTMNTSPPNTVVCIPGSTTITTSANSIPGSTTQWLINTGSGFTNLTIASPYSVSTSTASGVTTSVLTINPASTSINNYQYEATFTNSRGNVTSSAATLNAYSRPSPSFVSPTTTVCQNTTGVVYTTQSGQSNYQWTISGGTITSGGTGTDNTATVTWSTAGTESISVNYANSNNCSAASATTQNVTVNAVPADKTVTAPTGVFSGSSANITVSSSATGVSYQLRNNATNANVGSAQAGNNGTLTFNTGALTTTTTYNILATNTVGNSCTFQLSTTPTINVVAVGDGYYQSQASGTWNTASNWQTSPDNSTWVTSTTVPNSNAISITVLTANTISVSAAATASNLTINGKLTMSSGITLGVTGNWTNNGTFNQSTSTVTFDGSTPQTIGGSTNGTFYNLVINETTASNTVTSITSAFNVSGALTVTQGDLILEATDQNYAVTGNITVSASGTLTNAIQWGPTSTMLVASGNVTINGVYNYSYNGVTRSVLEMNTAGTTITMVSNSGSALSLFLVTNTSGTISASGSVVINDNFWAEYGTAGTFSIPSGQTVTANGGLFNNGGTFLVNGGTLNVSGGIYDGYASSSLAGAFTLSSGIVNITNTGLQVGDGGSHAGTFSMSGGTLNITGNVTINSNGTFTATNSPAINVAGDWTNNNGGTFTPATSTVTFDGSGAQNINGTATTQTFDLVVLSNSSGSLTVGGSTTTLNLNDDFTITAGTFVVGTATTINAAGDWINNGAFASGAGKVIFDATTGLQNITGSTPTTFYNVTLSNSSGLVLGVNTTISNVLTLTSGMVTTGSNTLIISANSATSISGATTGRYIYGNLTMGIPNGGSSTQNFPIGDASNYTPINLTFTGTVTGSGSLTAFTTPANAPTISTSAINEAEDILRYWSLTNNGVTGFTNYSITLNYIINDSVGNPALTGANFVMGLYNGSWNYPTIGTRTANAAAGTGLVTATGITPGTGFGVYQLGQNGAGIPTMNTQPTSQAVCTPVSTSFTTVANSVPASSIQWQVYNGTTYTNISNSSPYSINTTYTATTSSSTLTINPTNTSLSGLQYSCIFTNTKGSVTSAAATLTVNPLPAAAITTSPANGVVCTGAPATLTANPTSGMTYAWFTPPGGTSGAPVVNPTSTTSYTVTVTNASTHCTATASATLTVPLPTASITETDNSGTTNNDGIICNGASATLTANPTTGVSYSWFTTATSDAIKVSPATTTPYTVTVTEPTSGCSLTVSNTVTVDALPVVTVTPNYCYGGGDVQLTSTAESSYIWSTGETTQTILVDEAGLYTVTATNSNACSSSASDEVAIELVTNGNFSSGNTGFTTGYTYISPAANAATTGGDEGLEPEGDYAVDVNAHTYHPLFWGIDHTTGTGNFMIVNGDDIANQPIVWQETVTIQPNTVYYFSAWAMSVNTVGNYAELQFDVNGVSVGTIANLGAGPNNATQAAANNYWQRFYGTWNSGSSTSAIISIVDLQTIAGGNDFGLDDISCSTLSTLSLGTTPTNSTSPMCVGGNIVLSSNRVGGESPFTYSWSGPSFTSSTDPATISSASTSNSGNYSITVTDAHGCSASSSVSVTVNALPAPTFTSAPTSITCSSTNVTYATQTGQSSYVWSVPGTSGTDYTITAGGIGATNSSVTLQWLTAGSKTVTVNYNNSAGCTAVAPVTNTTTVDVRPTPTFTTVPSSPICASANATYTTQSGQSSYVWVIPGVQNTDYTIASGSTSSNSVTLQWLTAGSKTVTVNYNDASGCNGLSAASNTTTVNALPTPTFVAAGSTTIVNYNFNSGSSFAALAPTLASNITCTAAGSATFGTATGVASGSNAFTANSTAGNALSSAPNNTWTFTIGGTGLSGYQTFAVYFQADRNTGGSNTVNVTYSLNGGTYTSTGITATVGAEPLTMSTSGTWYEGLFTIPAGANNPTTSLAFQLTIGSSGTGTVQLDNFEVQAVGTGGPSTVCQNSTGNVYTTQSGQTNYIWTINGGTITAGGGTGNNTATVTWNTPGSESISVNYTNSSGCTALSPMVQNVTVNAVPTPTFTTAPTPVCLNSTGNVYTTQPGQSNYIWTISGGTITSGGGTGNNTATVTWNTSGTESINVNYTNASGCTAASATTQSVTVNSLPAPTFTTAPTPVCNNSTGSVYTTQSGFSNYIWTINGGTITSGGGTGNNTATVTWNTAGSESISVNYTIASTGCTAGSATVQAVTVNALPTPTFTTAPTPVCNNSTGNVYTTQTGFSNYVWTINGGTITSGGGSTNNTATVTWNTVGSESISVNYTNSSTGCTALSATTQNVTVNALPTPTFTTAPTPVCLNSTGNVYTTQSGFSNYVWTINGGTITSGGGTANNTATVTWNTAGSESISVNYKITSTGCTALSATTQPVTVNGLPSPTFTAAPATTCVNTPGYVYTTQAGEASYQWTISGGTITAGSTTNSATVTWNTSGTESIKINYIDGNGCTAASSTSQNVTVQTAPSITTPPTGGTVCLGSPLSLSGAASGSSISYQWQLGGVNIPSTTSTSYSVANATSSNAGNYTLVASNTACPSATSNIAAIVVTSAYNVPYLETFESITVQDQLPNCVTSTNLGTETFTRVNNPSQAYSGNNYGSWGRSADDWFFTAGINLIAGTNYVFYYFYNTDNTSVQTSMAAAVGALPEASSMTTAIGSDLVGTAMGATGVYNMYQAEFTPSTSGVYYFGSHVTTNSGAAQDKVTIDNIGVGFACNGTPTAGTASVSSNLVCAGSPVNLSVTGSTSGYLGITFQWQSSPTGQNAWSNIAGDTSNIATVTVSSSTDYRCNVNCLYSGLSDNTNTVTVIANTQSANPTSATATPAAICYGNSSSLKLNGGGGGTGEVIKWYTASCGGTLAGTGNNLSVSPTTTTVYYGRYEDGAPCSVNTTCASVTVTVNSLPVPVISFSESSGTTHNDGIICYGDPVTLIANPTTGMNYAWAAPISANGNNQVVSPASTTSYTVTVTNSTTNCSASTSATVTVNTLPTPTIGVSETSGLTNNDGITCSGDAVSLTANPTTGMTYQWAAPITTNVNNDNQTVNPTSTTTYKVTVTNSNACSATASTTITVNPYPVAYSVTGGACIPAQIGLSNSQTGVNYQLYLNNNTPVGSPLAGTGTSLNFGDQVDSGIYSVIATNPTSGCVSPMTGVATVSFCLSTWIGVTDTNWNTQTNWNPAAVPNNCYVDVLIPAGTPFLPGISQGDIYVRNINIASNVTLTLYGRNLNVCGNWTGGLTNNAAVIGNGTVLLNSPVISQTVTGNTHFDILEIDNSRNVTLNRLAMVSIGNGLWLAQGNLDVSAGTFTLLSASASNNSYIDDFSSGYTGTITGNVTAQRYVPVQGSNQHYISSPVSTPAFGQLGASGSPDGEYVVPLPDCDETKSNYNTPYGTVFQYNDGHMPPGGCMLGNWQVRETGGTVNGQGYSVYLTGNSTLSLTSTANTGNTTVSTFNSAYVAVPTLQQIEDGGNGAIESGWALVGNPYPSALDLTIDRTGDDFDDQVQIWKTSGPFAGTWQPDLITGEHGAVVIPPFQAFMVHVSTGQPKGNYTYHFYQSERTRTTNLPFYRTQNQNTLQLLLNYNGMQDITTVSFNPSATNTFDPEFDAVKQDGGATNPTLYTFFPGATTWYAINTVPSLTQTAVVPMGLRPVNTGTMTISPQGIESFDPTTYIYLEDKQTGTWTNLRNGAYTFTTTPTDNQQRFVLHFTPPAIILTQDASCDAPGMINIQQPGMADWNYTVTDNNNATISSGTLNNNNPVSVTVSPGVYTLTLKDANGYTVAKNIEVQGTQTIVAAFNSSVSTAQVLQNITFNSTTASASVYSWDFGDGSSGTGVTTTHNYSAEGVYNVALRVENAAGCTSSTTHAVTVTSRSVTGISNISGNGDISIWSNEDRVYVDFSAETSVDADIEIYNVLGQVLSDEKFGKSSIYSKQIVNMEAAYMIVKVTNNDEITTKKVFISNVNK